METPDNRKNPAREMFTHFNLSRWIISILFVIIISGFFYRQYEMMKARQLDRIEQSIFENIMDMDSVISYTSNQIIQMEYWAEYNYLFAEDDESPHPLLEQIRHHDAEGFFCFGQPQTSPLSELTGNFFGLDQLDLEGQNVLREANMALNLFSLQRSSLAANDDLIWSQYLSKNNFSTIYPWVPGGIILQQADDLKMATVFANQYDEFSQLLQNEPENGSKGYWQAAASDIRGNEVSIRYSVPVQNDGEVMGIITAGIQPDFLQKTITECPLENSNLLVVNDARQVLAQCAAENEEEAGELLTLDEVLPPDLEQIDFPALQGRGFQDFGSYRVYVEPLTQAPWHLVFYYPKVQLLWVLFPMAITGFAVIIIVVIVLYMVTLLLQRNFVTPAIALVDFIQAELLEDSVPLPVHLSATWKALFRNISDTFALKAVTANVPGAVYQLARSRKGVYHLRFLSGGIREFLDYDPDELVGESDDFLRFIPEDERKDIEQVVEESAQTMQPFHYECRVETRNGERKWARFTSRPRLGENNVVVWDGLILDITDRKELETDLAHLAATDVLTNINNRRHYMTMSEKEFSRFSRNSHTFSVILFDIDDFKIVNDTYGHPAGDQVLMDVADILCSSIREEDIEGRVGGEEFAVTLVNSDLEHALTVAERLRRTVESHVVHTPVGDIRVTISIGVTQVNARDRNLSALLSRADKALYDAKKAGKNRVIGV